MNITDPCFIYHNAASHSDPAPFRERVNHYREHMLMATKRIYRVKDKLDDRLVMVRATSRAQAISHRARVRYEAAPITVEEMATYMTSLSRIPIEDAGDPEPEAA